MSALDVLNLPMQENDAEAATVREYLVALLDQLWSRGEGFSGKRPFGNSGWQYDLYLPLIQAGMIQGTIDDDGYIDDVDETAGDRLILEAIAQLGAVA